MMVRSRNREQMDLLTEKIVDSFAGGGGASTGIELATGRVVDIAINHDRDAILMHKTNHPHTRHYQASVWDVDPEKVCAGSPVGLAWFSPDCKHFSKAKGGKPVDKNIRGLAWIVLRWAGTVRPRVIILENVEEFQTWGPLITVKNQLGRNVQVPDPERKGETFNAFVGMLGNGVDKNNPALLETCEILRIAPDSQEAAKLVAGLGYTIEWRELVAADYGAPTTRKRFFMVARCDGRPITWPEPTHAPRGSEAVESGRLKPWRSAAEVIDWSLPCPSIFDSKQEIKKKYGITAVRPLAEKTMRRAIRGVDQFTIKSGEPFLVMLNHGEDGRNRTLPLGEPMPTVTATHGLAAVDPILSPITVTNTTNSVGSPADKPLHTVTTAGNQMLVCPSLTAIGQTGGGDRVRDVREPTHTSVSKAEECLIGASLIQYHTEQTENVRGQQLQDPVMTIDAANRYGLVSASFTKYYGNDDHGHDAKGPLHTITAKDREGLLAASLSKFYGGVVGSKMSSPLSTVTSIDHNALTVAHMMELYRTAVGRDLRDPASTVTASGAHHAVVTTTIVRAEEGVNLRRWPEVRALLNKHCGYELADDEVLLLLIGGSWYFISDIGLRMLTPRELYAANGFPADYIIDRDYEGNEYGKTKQVARCGNAVPPPFATALVRANLPEWCNGNDITSMAELERRVAV